MRTEVYLHLQVVEVLRCFGELSDVVNDILQAGADGIISLMDLPAAPPRDGSGRYPVTIRQQDYLDLLDIYGYNNPRVSLRRILYTFVEEQQYELLGWKMREDFVPRDTRLMIKHLTDAQDSIGRAISYCKSESLYDDLKDIKIRLRQITDELQQH